jgi:hypothetical protein
VYFPGQSLSKHPPFNTLPQSCISRILPRHISIRDRPFYTYKYSHNQYSIFNSSIQYFAEQNKSLVADENVHELLRFTISTNVKKDVEQPYNGTKRSKQVIFGGNLKIYGNMCIFFKKLFFVTNRLRHSPFDLEKKEAGHRSKPMHACTGEIAMEQALTSHI